MGANSWDRPGLRATSVNGSVQWVLKGGKRGSHGMAAATLGLR